MKDNTFNREEKLFRSLEKTVRLCLKNISFCLQHIQVRETQLFSMFLPAGTAVHGYYEEGMWLLVKEAIIKAWVLFFVPLPVQPFPHPNRQIVGRLLIWLTHGTGHQHAFFTLDVSAPMQNCRQGRNFMCLFCLTK